MNYYRCDYGLHLAIDHAVKIPQNVMQFTPGEDNEDSGANNRGNSVHIDIRTGGREVLRIPAAGACR